MENGKLARAGAGLIIAITVLFSLLFAGCLKEDRGHCPPTNTRFVMSYTYNMESADLFSRDFRSVLVRAFDAWGVEVAEFRATPADIARGVMDAELDPGTYTFVAWGTSGDVLEDGGYRTAGATMDDHRLHLDNPSQFDDLYHAIARNVKITETEVATVPLEFIRHTNIVRLRIRKGMNAVTRADTPPLDIHVVGKKGTYAHDGMIHTDTPEHRYDAKGHRTQGDDLHSELHLQRFDVDFHAANPVTLNVGQDGTPLIRPLDLVALLRMNPAYATQAALDRASEFDIEIWLKAESEVVITIDGWVVRDIGAEIGASRKYN
jgi:hypothetical protein